MKFMIYPAIDLRLGKVVRLKEGDPALLTTYSADPAETAQRWLEMGATWLHIINLDGAFGEADEANRLALQAILKVAKEYHARVQFGGGVRSLEMMEHALAMGISRLVLGTIAIDQPDLVTKALHEFGAKRIAVGIDARDGIVRTRGWRETSGIPATDLARRMHDAGLRTAIFTDISRDGLGSGLNIPATKALAETSGLDVIASGGVHTQEDVLAARRANLAGVIIGRALYEGSVDFKEVLESTIQDIG